MDLAYALISEFLLGHDYRRMLKEVFKGVHSVVH